MGEMGAGFQIYVIATRPFAEKVIGGTVASRRVSDGSFFLDRADAEDCCRQLNEMMEPTKHGLAGPPFKVYAAIIEIEKEEL